MRKIKLCDSDAAFFDEEMMPGDYEYLTRHKDTFRRMWLEQGKTFWTQFISVFRSYIVRYSLLGDLPCDISQLQNALDFAFVVINENFVDGKANQARNFLYSIADLCRNKHKFVHLDSKSFTKDPFYTKDTRDIFREFFGPATEKASYVRVYLLSPVYMRFGRSVVHCLELWKDAPEIDPTDESYYISPQPLEHHSNDSLLCPVHLEECNMKYYQQFMVGSPNTPVALDIWGTGDPRRCEPGNPLFNPQAPVLSDWRIGLTCEKFREFYMYCSSHFVKPEDQCPDCRVLAKKARKKLKKKLKKQVMGTGEGELLKVSGPSDQDAAKTTGSKDRKPAQNSSVQTEAQFSSKKTRTTVGSGGDSVNGPSANSVIPMNSKPVKRECFTCNSMTIKRQDDVRIMSPTRKNEEGRMLFEVLTKKDPRTNCVEIRMVVKEVDMSKLPGSAGNACRILGSSQPPLLNADHIRQLVPGLPPEFQWAEGGNWCAASVDYTSIDASGEKPHTKFILKITSPDVYVAKEANFALLKYVVQRKRRPSAGWVLSEDDVFTWCQELKKEDLEKLSGAVFTISTGMELDDAISLAEDKTRSLLPRQELSLQSQRAIQREIDMCNMLTQAWQQSKTKEKSVDFIDLDEDDAPPKAPAATNGGDSSAAAGSKKGKKSKKESKKVAKANTSQAPAIDFAAIDPMTAALHNTLATISGNSPNLGPPQVVSPTELGLPEGCDVIGICAKGPDGQNKYLLTARDPYDTKTAKILKDLGYETIDFGLSQYDEPQVPRAELPVAEQVNLAIKALEAVEAQEELAKDQAGSRPLSVCANCKTREPVPKTYKKCQRCKDEGVIEARYYCDKKCQGEDWAARHRAEHKTGTLH